MNQRVNVTVQSKRNSSIELLKIIAMFMIVINHVTRSLQPPQFYDDIGYSILLSSTPENIQVFLLSLFCYFGPIGNSIFLISSIWFLLEDKTVKNGKTKKLVIDTWTVSIVLCAIFTAFGPSIVPRSFIIRSAFPIAFCNNWYVTCYFILYLVHPALNLVVEKLDQKSLLSLATGLFIAYFIVAFISEKLLYYSNLMFFLSSYLIVGYFKRYSDRYVSDNKVNQRVILITTCTCILLHILTMLCGKFVPAFSSKMLMWTSNNNPFIFFMTFSIFNIVRSRDWKNTNINNISSLTLLIYIIHENLYVKNVLRPYIWEQIYLRFGHSYIVLSDIIYSTVLFAATCLLAVLFKWINRKLLYKVFSPIIDWGMSIITRIPSKL